jgi:hypothetical protein
MSDGAPKLIAIDEEANDQIMQSGCWGKAHRAAHEALALCPVLDGCARNGRRVLLADCGLLRGQMTLVGAPAIGEKRWRPTARAALAAAARVPRTVIQSHPRSLCHGGDRWCAVTPGSPLACPPRSTSHPAPTATRDVGPSLPHEHSRPPHKQSAGLQLLQ